MQEGSVIQECCARLQVIVCDSKYTLEWIGGKVRVNSSNNTMHRVLNNISPLLRHTSKESFTAFGTKPTLVRNISVSCKNFNSFKIQDVNDFNERVKNSKVPVIVDFFATWCNPCRMLTPRIESVIAEKKGQVVLAKVDIDEQTDLALDYDVSSVPVLVAIKGGKEEDRLIGLQDVDKLKKFVDNVCGSTAAAAAKA